MWLSGDWGWFPAAPKLFCGMDPERTGPVPAGLLLKPAGNGPGADPVRACRKKAWGKFLFFHGMAFGQGLVTV